MCVVVNVSMESFMCVCFLLIASYRAPIDFCFNLIYFNDYILKVQPFGIYLIEKQIKDVSKYYHISKRFNFLIDFFDKRHFLL